MYWLLTFGVVTAIVIEGILPHFNLLDTGDKLMQALSERVPSALPEPVQQFLLLLWRFLTIAVILVVPLRKKKPRSQKASVRRACNFLPVRVSHGIKDAKRWVWSVLIEGGRYEQLRWIYPWNDICVPLKWKFYHALSDISVALISQARHSRAKWSERIEPNTAFSLDASWSHGRPANHRLGALMDFTQQSFGYFEVVPSSFGSQKKVMVIFEGAIKTTESRILWQSVD
jgi:hypothetical protein